MPNTISRGVADIAGMVKLHVEAETPDFWPIDGLGTRVLVPRFAVGGDIHSTLQALWNVV